MLAPTYGSRRKHGYNFSRVFRSRHLSSITALQVKIIMTEHTNDASNADNPVGYPDHIDPHLTHEEANQVLMENQEQCLEKFRAVLQMTTPVSAEKAHGLMMALVREVTTSYADYIADTMRAQDWGQFFPEDDSLLAAAGRAADFFNTETGLQVYNFYVKTYSKTNGTMF